MSESLCYQCGSKTAAARSRHAETWLAYMGAFQALVAGLLESLAHAGIKLGTCPITSEHWWAHVPWFNLVVLLVCVLPKTLGRMAAGKVWETLASRFGGKQA